jgi:hypothetical protein
VTSLNVSTTNQEVANHLLASGGKNRAKTINELRHQCTDYDQVIDAAEGQVNYADIVASAKLAITDLINNSRINRYEKYLYELFNKRWNFFKKNDIAQRSSK